MPVKNLFGTSGVRGLAKTEITKEFSKRLGKAFGAFIGKKRVVVVGRDNRPGSEMVSKAVKAGLETVGVEVKDFGVVPTPELSFHLLRIKADGGVMITGSHLPIEYLGIVPVLADGCGVFGKVGEQITKIFYEQK